MAKRIRQQESTENPAPAEAGTADAADNAVTPTAGAPRPFTLDITFSGLCLLVRRTKRQQLLVLLPDTRVHENGRDVPEHLAVLGAHERYTPEGPFDRTGRVREVTIGEGSVEFLPSLITTDGISLEIDPALSVADLTDLTKDPPLPGQSRVEMGIRAGKVCRDCTFDSGATWLFNGGRQRMATRLSWRITGVTNTTRDGRPGVVLRFPTRTGGHDEFVVRPIEDKEAQGGYRAAFYLYHAPASELPSSNGHPDRPMPDERGDPELNHHFGAFYDLFRPRLDTELPERVPDDDEDDEEDDDGEAEATTMNADAAIDFVALRAGGYHGFHGRLYTCTIATVEDDQTPA